MLYYGFRRVLNELYGFHDSIHSIIYVGEVEDMIAAMYLDFLFIKGTKDELWNNPVKNIPFVSIHI